MSLERDTQDESERVGELERRLLSERAEYELRLASAAELIAKLERERDILRQSHARLREELELLKKKLFVAKTHAPEVQTSCSSQAVSAKSSESAIHLAGDDLSNAVEVVVE